MTNDPDPIRPVGEIDVNPIVHRFQSVKPEPLLNVEGNHIVERADGKFYYPPLDDFVPMTPAEMQRLIANGHWREVSPV